MLRLLLLLLFPALLRAEPLSLDRIVLIGASVSHGFHASEPLGGEKSAALKLDRFLDSTITAPHGKIINDASHLLFLDAEKQAGAQIQRTLKRKPTLVVGVDFLFWFLYGWPGNTGDRLALFERGLELLDAIDTPLVLGDIPDASAAAGGMLAPEMIPDRATIATANRRLAEWAAERGKVSIVPLSAFMAACVENTSVRTGKHLWQDGQTRALLQPDHLHPDQKGCTALALAIGAALVELGLADTAISWEPAAP